MKRFRLTAAAAVSILAVVAAAAGGVVAATQSSDEQALRPTREPADRRIESRVNHLLSKMTLEEKADLIGLLRLGRGDGTLEEWDDMRAEGFGEHAGNVAAYLMGEPMLGDYLEEGLDRLGYSVEDIEDDVL